MAPVQSTAAANKAPVVMTPLADKSFAEDSPVSFTLPANSFTDADGDALTYTATTYLNAALPAWLSFDAASRTFSGTPLLNYNGTVSVRVIASDGTASTSDVFDLVIAPVNDAPRLVVPFEDVVLTPGQPFGATFSLRAFTDADNDALTYTAALADGTALPSWLTFDPATRFFRGTAPLDYHGTLSVKVTASDGTASTSDTFDITVPRTNTAPVLDNTLADKYFAKDSPIAFTLPANSFSDADGDTLTYTAKLVDGSALPTWLSFDAASRSFSGTPPLNFTGFVSVKVTVTDGTAFASDSFAIGVLNAPLVANPLADQSFAQNSRVAFTLPANSFSDADGDALHYTATLADGSALPTWLRFSATSGSFSGTPPLNYTGTLSIKVTASDGVLFASDTFDIAVSHAPVVANPLTEQSFAEDSPVAFTLPANSFTDADGDALTYTATLADGTALPSWLSFNATSRSFSGTPPLNDNGTLSVKVTASDGSFSTSDTFNLAIASVNDAPVLATPLADQSFAEDSPVSFTLPANSFRDADGDALTYSATMSNGHALPDWLSFDAASRTFSGTPPLNLHGTFVLKVTASDGTASTADIFVLAITPVNDAPVLVYPHGDPVLTQGMSFGFSLPPRAFTDADGDVLTYTATRTDGTALPSWLIFDAASRSFSGTAPLNDIGTLSVRVTASDGTDATSDTFDMTTIKASHAPVVANPLPDQVFRQGQAFRIPVPDSTFYDADGDRLNFFVKLADGSTSPWIYFNGREIVGSPPSDFTGTLSMKITASDGGRHAEDYFDIVIAPNDAPVVANPLADRSFAEDSPVAFALPADAFSDADGDTLTYTATLADGSALPAWLSFDANSRSFSGTPPLNYTGTLSVKVTASDGILSTSDAFNLAIASVNDAPVLATPLADQSFAEDSPVAFTLPTNSFSDVDGDALTYTATLADGTALPTWLSFDAASRSFSGTPPLNYTGTLSVKVTASDGAATTSDTFVLAIAGDNDAPVVANPLADQSFAEDSPLAFTLPANSFSDADGDALTYTTTLADGSALPTWLSFDAASRSFIGTPPLDFNGTLSVKVTASDGAASSSDTFDIVVSNANDAPVVANPLADQSFAEDSPVAFTLPANTFSDVDGDALTYTATLADGSALPAWLSFDATRRSFSGTPPLNFNGTLSVKVTASDGAATTSDTFVLAIAGDNDAPVVVDQLADQSFAEDSPVAFTLPANSFSDADGDTLTYTAALADGTALPTWLSFNATSRSFSGTPPLNYSGTLSVKVTASDGTASVSDNFDLAIAGDNDAPVVATPLTDQSFAEDSPIAFTLPANTFSDVDVDALTYNATLADGSALPAWLSFDAANRSFSGTPPLNYTGTLSVKVTASDGTASVSDIFNLSVSNANDAPVVATPLADQSFAEDSPVAFTLPANSFSDADGDTLTYTATLADGSALPTWLSFDAGSRSFSGTPPLNFNGTLTVRVTASDGTATVSDTFNIVVSNADDAPVVATPLADQSFAEDSPVAFTLPANSFSDADGDTLIYTATLVDGSALPSWLSFNAASRSFSGTPPLNYTGTLSVKVTASDGAATTSDTFNLAIAAANDAPVIANPLADQSFAEDSPVAFTLPADAFSDVDEDALTYTATRADGSALPSWLSFDAASRSFSGTPPLHYTGTLSVKVTASDGNLSTSDTFVLAIAGDNDAPVLANPLADQSFAEDGAVAFTLPANTFSDVDGDALTYTATLADGSALPTWLSFDAASRSFSGTPPLNYNGTLSVKVTAFDGILSTSDIFDIAVSNVNDAPVVTNPLVDQSFAEDSPLAFTLPADSFSDADGDALPYTATLADGSALPSWLSFDAASRSFSGTPPLNYNGTISVKVTASDGTATVSDTFVLAIAGDNDAPVVANAMADQSFAEDSPVAFTLPANSFTDADGDTLTYTATLADGSALPTWLSFNAASRSFSGTPPLNFNGTLSVKVTASDGTATVSDNFNLTVTPANDAPVVANPLADQSFAEDSPIAFTLPANTFSDVDGDALTYNATLADGSALPAWLSFDATSRSFSGTPPFNYNGTISVKVTASDGILSTSDTFDLAIAGDNDAPVVATPLTDQSFAEDSPVAFTLPADAFSDVDEDALTYTATRADGSALPSWLSFDAASRSFSGTPPLHYTGTLSVKVTAFDGILSTSDTFALSIAGDNDAPVLANPLADQSFAEDSPVAFTLPANSFSDADGDTLTYAATLADGSALPSWLSFDAASRSFSGTPPLNYSGTISVKVTAFDGILSTSDTFVLAIAGDNDAPVVVNPLADQSFAEDSSIAFTLPANSFTDADGDTLTYTATLADGSALPSWLSFDAASRSFSGTPPLNFNGSLSLKVTASDGTASNSDTIALAIAGDNDAPVLANPLADQSFAEDSPVAFTLPANSFSDADGDTLTYTAILADGTALPAWLSFDATSRSFSGTPPLNYTGTLSVKVTASDGAASSSDTFDIVLSNANDAPVVANAIADQSFAEDSPVAFTLPADAFSDADGDALTYMATLADGSALPTWLSFNAASRSFSGTPPLNFNGTLSVKVTASDGTATVSDNFNLAVTPANDAPVVANPLADQSFAEDSSIAFTLPADAFSDVDGDALTYTATRADGSALPSWLSFNAASRSFSGTPPLNFNGTLSVKVTASDGILSTSDTFDLAIAGDNDAPVVVNTLADQSFAEDGPVAFTVPANIFSDADGDALTYTATRADDSALPTWLSFDAASRSFSGTPPLNYNGTISVKVTAFDGILSTSDIFDIAVSNVNDAPVVTNPLVYQSFAEDSPLAFTLPADSFSDVDGDALTYTATLADGSALPAWLSFDATRRSFSGTPPLNFNGTLSVKVTASDGAATTSDTFVLAIAGDNDAPVVATPLADQSFAEDSSIAFTLPANSFSDADGDTLTYTATLADGTALPAWLSFDATSRSFSGTPQLNYTGTLSVKVTASDGILSTSDTFALAIAGDNDAPVVANPLADRSFAEDSPVAFTLPANTFSDVDGDALTYTATLADGSALPAWLSFDTTSRTFSGMPANGDVGTISVKLTASDGTATVSESFDIVVANTNDAPVVATAIANQSATQDQAFALSVAQNFADVDAGDVITYTATLVDGSALPSWLSLDATTGTFSGTPANRDVAALDVKVTATDGANASVSQSFVLTVANVNDAPTGIVVTPVGGKGALAVAENADGAVIGTVATMDPDTGDTFSYGVDDARFEIVAGQLKLKAGSALDYEREQSVAVTVTSTDAGGLSHDETVTIVVTDRNDMPVPSNAAPVVASQIADQRATSGTGFTFAIPQGAFVDPDGNPLRYSVSGLPSWLSFDAATQTFVGTPAGSDAGVAVITVTADDGALSVSDTFNLVVADPGNPDSQVSLSADTVAENSARGTVIGELSGTDGDGVAFVSYTLGDNPGRSFRIVDGELVVGRHAKLDFETRSQYEITVIATDRNGVSVEESLTINVSDVAENPRGTRHNDRLAGDALDNIINGRRGNDRLTGGDGADTFVFGRHAGRDIIGDFDPSEGDVIDLSRAAGIRDLADLLAHHVDESGPHLRITAGDGSVLVIRNFDNAAELTENMFAF